MDNPSDCVQKKGTRVEQVPVQKFENKLKAILKLPTGNDANYTEDMQRKIELYRKGTSGNIDELERQRSEVDSSTQGY